MGAPTNNPADCFVAIDFETANSSRDSACAVALITVRGTEIVDRTSFLIRPPQPEFEFCHIHGICRQHVADQPTFGDLWPRIRERLEPATFVAAHNAAFDRAVLMACCEANGLSLPPLSFLCTLQLARSAWRLQPANLPAVCEFLSIPLDHHRAESDAEACARIVIAAKQTGVRLARFIQRSPAVAAESPSPDRSLEPPSERAIVTRLDRLGELRSQRDGLPAEKQARIDQVFPPEVRARLAEIDAEFTQKEESLSEEIDTLDAEVRTAVLGVGETVRGRYLSAQWVRGRITWDRRGLDRYSTQNPEILQFRREGDPSVRLQPITQVNQESEDAS